MYRQAIQDLVTKFVYDTANVTVMAYGQTGAGKTHTMIGTTSPPGDESELLPLVRFAHTAMISLQEWEDGVVSGQAEAERCHR